MLEARLRESDVLKKVLDAIKELVTDANFDCSDEGIKVQAMDSSHVALTSLLLSASGFEEYRCDRNMSLGMSLSSFSKIIKCAASDDVITLRADESHDVLAMLFESTTSDRVGEYEMKLMDIDQEHLGIPDTVYDAEISMSAGEFNRIIRDLKELGESIKIEVSKEGVRFSCEGDVGNASVTLKQAAASDDADEEEEEAAEEYSEEEQEEEDEKPVIKKKAKKIADDEEEEGDDDDEVKVEETVVEEEDAKPEVPKKRKSKQTNGTKKAGKKAKGIKTGSVHVALQQSVSLAFAAKYLSNFTKSTSLAETVNLYMSGPLPLLVEYAFDQGYIRYYLAPKIEEE